MDKGKKLYGHLNDLYHPETPAEADSIGNETARLFNSAIGAATIAATNELGLLDELQQNDSIRLKAFCDKHDLHHASMSALLHVLHCSEIVEINPAGDVVRKGPMFSNVYRDKGYFLWLICGYGYLLQHLSLIVENKARSNS